MKRPTDEKIRELASSQYHNDGSCEIDDNALISDEEGDDVEGCYVQAWVWVYYPKEEE